MKQRLFALLFGLLSCHLAVSQNEYNKKNVDRTAMSFYDGLQTFRAMEYSVTADPQSQKVYRLQTLSENGFPEIQVIGVDSLDGVFFEDKTPYDNNFTDNSTPFLSGEAVQLFAGVQKVMKTLDDRFQWKGIDGTGTIPVQLIMQNSDKSSLFFNSYAYYDVEDHYFVFGKSIQNATPLWCAVDLVAHEFSHAVMQYRSNVLSFPSSCAELRSIDEGLADVFGVYIKNKILQTTPQNYNWLMGESAIQPLQDIRDPKSYNSADTYKGQYYSNVCDHTSSVQGGMGIVPKWFYLLSAGFAGSATNDLGYQYGNLTGIGVEKAIHIIWNSIPDLKGHSTYSSLKTYTLKAAELLYGLNSAEYLATDKAWCAVGVCDNNLPFFTIYPANTASNVDPWPGVKINFSWDDDPRVKEVEVQMSLKYDFSDNPQAVKVNNFDKLFKPGGGVVYRGSATGYFLPGATVYVRAKITQADPNFCKGLNPLCKVYQQYTPTNILVLSDKKAEFWHGVPSAGFIGNAWDNPKLEWKPVADAEEYTFQIAQDKNFINFIDTESISSTGSFPESGIITTNKLEPDKYYYIRVRARRSNLFNNVGAWSKTDSLKVHTPPTSVLQALNQKPNDLPTVVSSLGFGVNYYTAPGATQYLVQVATDDAFANIVRSQVVPGNQTNALITLPALTDQTNLFVRVLPQKGVAYATCTNVWRIKTDKSATLLAMAGPDPKIPIPYKTYFGKIFKWNGGTVNLGLVDHFKVRVEEKESGQVAFFNTPGKALEKEIVDQLMYDDHIGIDVSVLAVGPQGSETEFSPAFSYTICQDQPIPKFPNDNDKIDPALPVTITWEPSLWQEPGEQYLVTILSNGIPVNGFNNALPCRLRCCCLQDSRQWKKLHADH
jgi:hypothetical protein